MNEIGLRDDDLAIWFDPQAIAEHAPEGTDFSGFSDREIRMAARDELWKDDTWAFLDSKMHDILASLGLK